MGPDESLSIANVITWSSVSSCFLFAGLCELVDGVGEGEVLGKAVDGLSAGVETEGAVGERTASTDDSSWPGGDAASSICGRIILMLYKACRNFRLY